MTKPAIHHGGEHAAQSPWTPMASTMKNARVLGEGTSSRRSNPKCDSSSRTFGVLPSSYMCHPPAPSSCSCLLASLDEDHVRCAARLPWPMPIPLSSSGWCRTCAPMAHASPKFNKPSGAMHGTIMGLLLGVVRSAGGGLRELRHAAANRVGPAIGSRDQHGELLCTSGGVRCSQLLPLVRRLA